MTCAFTRSVIVLTTVSALTPWTNAPPLAIAIRVPCPGVPAGVPLSNQYEWSPFWGSSSRPAGAPGLVPTLSTSVVIPSATSLAVTDASVTS